MSFKLVLKKIYFVFLVLTISFSVSFAITSNSYIVLDQQLVSRVENSDLSGQNIVFYQLDHNRNVRSEINTTGTMVDAIDYLPFGSQPSGEVTLIGDAGYQSMVFDFAVNLYSLYDPSIGRYIAPMTEEFSTLDSQSLNSYSFMRNNPFRVVQPQFLAMDMSGVERQDGMESRSVSGQRNAVRLIDISIKVTDFNANQLMAAAQFLGVEIGGAILRAMEPKPEAPPKPFVPPEEPVYTIMDDNLDFLEDPVFDLEPYEASTSLDPVTHVDAASVQILRAQNIEVTAQNIRMVSNHIGPQVNAPHFQTSPNVFGWNIQPGQTYTVSYQGQTFTFDAIPWGSGN